MGVELTGLPEVSEPAPWHREAWDRLGEQLGSGRLAHALLLAGSAGTGKAQFALALARLLLCARPKNGVNCGDCHPCRLTAGGSHGDFCWVQPEDKSRVIKIDQIRELVVFVNRTSSFGSRKVVVIHPADAMNINASNALLKALEEPVADTYLFLVCHRPHAVPATIRSRCQMIRLPTPGREQSLPWLRQLADDPDGLDELLALVDGRPLAAVELLREGRAEELAITRGAIQGVLRGQLSALEAAEALGDAEPGDFLLQLQLALHGLIRRQGSGALQRREVRAAFALDDDINRLRGALAAGANPNASLLVDGLLTRCERELGGALGGDMMEACQGGGQ
jgi:DNA polymerase-3 subunit delta'